MGQREGDSLEKLLTKQGLMQTASMDTFPGRDSLAFRKIYSRM
jgi:hypothetical protein